MSRLFSEDSHGRNMVRLTASRAGGTSECHWLCGSLCRWHSELDAQQTLSAAVAAQLAEPASVLGSAKAAAEFVAKTLTRAEQLGEPLPIELTGRLATALAERGHWDSIGALLAGAKLTTLSAAPGLASAAALAGQYALMSRLLLQVRRMLQCVAFCFQHQSVGRVDAGCSSAHVGKASSIAGHWRKAYIAPPKASV